MKCPGQDTQYWQPGAIFEVKCPKCEKMVEFFKDDTLRRCGHCGHRFVNPQMDFGCAAYCQYAEQCIGNLPPELLAQKEDLLKDRVAIEVKRFYKTDFSQIGRVARMAYHAEQIGKVEAVNLAVVLVAAYLAYVDNGCEGSTDGPADFPTARGILERLQAPVGLVEQVCDLLAKWPGASQDDEMTVKLLADAVRLTRLEEAVKHPGNGDAASVNTDLKAMLTDVGRQAAQKITKAAVPSSAR